MYIVILMPIVDGGAEKIGAKQLDPELGYHFMQYDCSLY